jgi:hypothetical protein
VTWTTALSGTAVTSAQVALLNFGVEYPLFRTFFVRIAKSKNVHHLRENDFTPQQLPIEAGSYNEGYIECVLNKLSDVTHCVAFCAF